MPEQIIEPDMTEIARGDCTLTSILQCLQLTHGASQVCLRDVLHRLAKLAVAIALLQICGGHWGMLQAIAWAGMLVNYTRSEASISTALEKTFDGEHPCDLCVAVKVGRDAEKKQETAKTLVKYEAVLAAKPLAFEPHSSSWEYSLSDEAAERVGFPPLSPPPVRA